MSRVYWGDLHNHCAVSYGQGTPERTLDNARQHLDFCTITGHAFWPDMPWDLRTQNSVVGIHLGGFAKLQHFWPALLRALEAANEPGRFVTLPSYEWHSLEYGDHNCYAPGYDLQLIDGPDLPTLTARVAAAQKEFFILPHHCGYTQGYRGTRWDDFDARRSPLVEIYSNHGCGEADDAPYDYYHSMGPRTGESMVRHGLAMGHRFGFYASTDSHDGYPGHYGHGKVGVMAETLELASLWPALRARRTIASTGARIVIAVDAGNGGIGDVLVAGKSRDLAIDVEGTAPLELLEWVEGRAGSWRIRRLATPMIEPTFEPGRYKIRVEAGWGRGSQRSQWQVGGRVQNSRILGIDACFRASAGSNSEPASTEKLEWNGDAAFAWQATASANPAGAMGGTHFNTGGTQSILLDVQADAGARLQLRVGDGDHDLALSDLARGSFARQTGGFGSTAFKVHRAVPEREFKCRLVLPVDPAFARDGAFGYLRVRQADGHVAWASPLWFE